MRLHATAPGVKRQEIGLLSKAHPAKSDLESHSAASPRTKKIQMFCDATGEAR
jgi:hypothetical protein